MLPRPLVLLAVLLGLSVPVAADTPLSRLAEALADEIARAAHGRPVEVGTIEDRTGRGAGFVLDLRGLVRSRLEGRASPAGGPPLRVEGVVTEAPSRLVVSARILTEPGSVLVDVISVSVASDPALLPFSPARPAGGGRSGFEVVGSSRTPPLDSRVVALALVGDDRLLVLHPEALALYRLEDSGLRREARRELPGPLEEVRTSGGLLLPTEGGEVWALTSRSPRAALFALEDGGQRLVERLLADALPWPGSPTGLRFRPGTNLLEGTVEGVGPGPFLAVTDGLGVAEAPDGELHLSTPEGSRLSGLMAGPALAPLGPEILLAASAAPPGTADAVLILARGKRELSVVDRLSVPGAVRALAVRARGDRARLIAAQEEPDGETYLLALDLRRTTP